MTTLLERLLPEKLRGEAAIERTIERILNARRRIPPKDDRLLGTVLDFGLGIVAADGLVSEFDLPTLAPLIANRIALFEPRLKQVSVNWDGEVKAYELRFVCQARLTDGSGSVRYSLQFTENSWKCILKEQRHG